jgi:hypothetical protein
MVRRWGRGAERGLKLALAVLNCRIGDCAVRRFDVAAMFVSLWLLASMIIDALTPKELTVYMIGAVTAPAFLILAIVYWRRLPKLDFAIILATLWMITVMVLEFITPRPLSLIMTLVASAPLVMVGCVVNYRRWRHSRISWPKSGPPSP